MSEPAKFILFFIFRVVLYAFIMVLLNMAYLHDATHLTSTGKFGENSLTEILQEIFLFMIGILFIVIGRNDHSLSPVSSLISLFFFMSLIRELSFLLDVWFYFVLLLLMIFVWLAYHTRKKLMQSLYSFIKSPFISWLVIGLLVTFLFSRLFGRTGLWKAIIGDGYNRWIKNAAEEGIELLGYSLIFIGGIEILIHVLKSKNHPEK